MLTPALQLPSPLHISSASCPSAISQPLRQSPTVSDVSLVLPLRPVAVVSFSVQVRWFVLCLATVDSSRLVEGRTCQLVLSYHGIRIANAGFRLKSICDINVRLMNVMYNLFTAKIFISILRILATSHTQQSKSSRLRSLANTICWNE